MQEKEFIMDVLCELKIPSLGMTDRHHPASLAIPNSYPRVRTSQPLTILIFPQEKLLFPEHPEQNSHLEVAVMCLFSSFNCRYFLPYFLFSFIGKQHLLYLS